MRCDGRDDEHAMVQTRKGGKWRVNYQDFIDRKTQVGAEHGFDPIWMPDMLFPFQKSLVEWAIRKGRAAVFADCGL